MALSAFDSTSSLIQTSVRFSADFHRKRMEFTVSQPKSKRTRLGNGSRIPVPARGAAEEDSQRTFVGIFTGVSVEVFAQENVEALHENGFYGTGSQTKSQPKAVSDNRRIECVTESQFSARAALQQKFKNECVRESKVAVQIPSSGNENECVERLNPFPIEESLVLTLEESYFLLTACRCLRIKNLDSDTEISTEEFLDICVSLQRDFVSRYVAFHYYRSKNWVVKSGLKFGGDFGESDLNHRETRIQIFCFPVLYREGPSFYHADYVVLVRDVENEPRFVDVQANYRVAETAHKTIILFAVKRPSDLDHDDAKSCMERLNEFRVSEVFPKRFQSTQGFKDLPVPQSTGSAH